MEGAGSQDREASANRCISLSITTIQLVVSAGKGLGARGWFSKGKCCDWLVMFTTDKHGVAKVCPACHPQAGPVGWERPHREVGWGPACSVTAKWGAGARGTVSSRPPLKAHLTTLHTPWPRAGTQKMFEHQWGGPQSTWPTPIHLCLPQVALGNAHIPQTPTSILPSLVL